MRGRVGLWAWRILLLLVTGVIIISSAALPDKLIGLFGVGALWMRIESAWSFGLALIFLAVTPIAQYVGQSGPAKIYPIYAFYFLIIGTIQAVVENARGEVHSLERSRSSQNQKTSASLPVLSRKLTPISNITATAHTTPAWASTAAKVSSRMPAKQTTVPRPAPAKGLRPEVAPRSGGRLLRF